MLSELVIEGKRLPSYSRDELRLALSVTARNALGRREKESAQE